MGFATVYYVHKYIADNYSGPKNFVSHEWSVEDFQEVDFATIVRLDEVAFGDKRSNFLRNRIKQSKRCIVVKDHQANIIGFGMSIAGPINLILGPIVAPDAQTATDIFDTLTKDHNGKLRIDVPSGHAEFTKFLERSGFTEANTPPVMMLRAEKCQQEIIHYSPLPLKFLDKTNKGIIQLDVLFSYFLKDFKGNKEK